MHMHSSDAHHHGHTELGTLGTFELSANDIAEFRAALEQDLGRALPDATDDEIRAAAFRTIILLDTARQIVDSQAAENDSIQSFVF